MPRTTLLAAIVLATMSVLACAASPGAGASGAPSSISISEAWARPASAGGESAGYLVITNTGSAADTLVSASSTVAASVELHTSEMDASGMMGMHPVDGIEIPAGASVALEPGAYHLMVMGLREDLAVGDPLEFDLVFQHAGTLTAEAEVKGP